MKGSKVLKETLCNYFCNKGDDDRSKSKVNGDPEGKDVEETAMLLQ